MKLSAQQIETVRRQFGVEPIAEDNPAIPTLKDNFGDHTFYVDTEGLNVLEPADVTERASQLATVVQLASWADDQKTALVPHEPLVRDIIVQFDSNCLDG